VNTCRRTAVEAMLHLFVWLVVRQAALELERVRSAKIASLPPPPHDPLDDIEPVKCECGFFVPYIVISY
jgi:hypothetical protein